jgi:hypothetical protein
MNCLAAYGIPTVVTGDRLRTRSCLVARGAGLLDGAGSMPLRPAASRYRVLSCEQFECRSRAKSF